MNVQTPTIDLAAIKGRQQAAWGSGDYARIGTTLQIVGEMLCEAVDLRSNQRVLDVAAGNGNATLAAARRFADVVSTDYVGALLERGRERAEAEPPAGHLPGSRRRSAALRRRELRCRAVDLRRHVHAEPGEGRERAAPRLPSWREDRPRQLDAGGLHRPAVQDHRQICAAGARREVAGAVGHQGPSRHPVRRQGDGGRDQQEFCVPLQVAQALGRTLPRPITDRSRRRSPRSIRRRAKRSRPISTPSSTNSTSPRTARWSPPANISKLSSPRRADSPKGPSASVDAAARGLAQSVARICEFDR